LASQLDAEVGRPRTLSLLGFFVAAQINALHRHHRAHLVEIARILNALTVKQRTELGIVAWDPEDAYHRVERLFVKLVGVLDDGFDTHVDGTLVHVDAAWVANRITQAAIPDDGRPSASLAVD